MSRAETKVQRILQIEALLLNHPEGLSQAEIARRLNVNRSTIHRYLPDLTTHAPIYEEDGRIFIDRKSYLVNLKLNLYEALALHLATRLMTNRLERHNPHAASLLRKLSETIEKLSPQISKHMSLSADVADDPSRFQDPHYLSVLETLAVAWAEGREVKIWHRHTGTEQVYQYIFSVYFIEPYAIGHAIHIIGLRNPPGELRTFNIARIERIEITNKTYKIPEDFDPAALLKQAWGIWYTEKEPQEVKLRFSSKVANRLLETRWHPSEETRHEPDGSLLWQARVAEPKEMIPWIRGWGADCEVLSPPNLRQKLINEISAMRDTYINPKIEQYMELWAKFSKENERQWHPLLWHMLDTAAVVELLWKDCLCESFKSSLASNFDLSIADMGKLISFWTALHDIGKAGPEFQKKNLVRQQHLESLGCTFPTSKFRIDGFHATATTLILKRILSNENLEFPLKFRINLAITLGGHHGEFPSDQMLNQKILQDHHVGDEHWQTIQNEIFTTLKDFLEAPEITHFPKGNIDTNPIFMLLVGLTTAADWIASNETFFPYTHSNIPIEGYYDIARQEAKAALETLGWYGWKAKGEPLSFSEIFTHFSPNKIQQTVIGLVPELESPFLAIIEAPTGSGKTEAALYIADTVTQRDEKAGIYIAMPTQATSNQMFSRTAEFLSQRYSQDEINLHLVHGAALMNDKRKEYQPTGIWGDDKKESNIQSHSWFLPRKRTLLAPFGVGTVDQTFLSVLKSRHFFLRLFGLSHKVLIFDEVHAYDVYMTEIFKTLLHWLRAVGTSVIILSATLPHDTRLDLLQAYSMDTPPDEQVDFPRISIATRDRVQIVHAGDMPSRDIHLEWIDQNPNAIVTKLKAFLSEGGCAAVICNRINRAQQVYDAVSTAFQGEKIDIILFHSRYPFLWRKQIEEQVLNKFGKNRASRPYKAIVIATQVIEQSLDLDFDLMISDLAPVDLLIQRIGRLHRHEEKITSTKRPLLLKEPTCIISAPQFSPQLTQRDFGSDQYIYEPYLLLRTLLGLKGRDSVRLPQETDALIHEVYSFDRPANISDQIWEILQHLCAQMKENHAKSATNARNFLIPTTEISFLGSMNSSLGDDISGNSRKLITAPTREISPSIQIVCLTEDNDGLHILGDKATIDLNVPLSSQQITSCLHASATLNNRRVLQYLITNHEIPETFKNNAMLRWHFPIVFKDLVFSAENITLHLDRMRGIQVISN